MSSEVFESQEVVLLYGFSLQEAKSFLERKATGKQRVILFSETEEAFFPAPREKKHSYEIYSNPSDEILGRIAWESLFNSLCIAFSPALTEQQKVEGDQLFARLQHWQRGARAVLADVRDMGKKVIGNIVRNLPLLAEAHTISPFCQAFQGIPAIICGAGPSLEKSMPVLRQLQERAVILAGGSALNALTHASITPHFAAALDPDPPSHLFRGQAAVEAPLFYQNRVAHRLLQDNHGEKIWVPDNVSYPLEAWLMERLGLDATAFEAGWNVATFSLHIAVAMGCNPIIITGVDLCHPQGRAYADGVEMPATASELIPVEPGKESKSDFLLAAEWIEGFVAAHPQTTFINASIGGLALQGMQHVPPQELAALLPPIPCDLMGKINSTLQVTTSSLPSPEKIEAVLQEFKENIELCRSLLERMAALLQKWYPEDPSSKGDFILLEVELEEQPVYTHVLQSLWNVWQWVLCPSSAKEPQAGVERRLQKILFFQTALQEIRGDYA